METFDAIVIGTGGVGSAALYQLAKRGLRVLGLDQFAQAHANGSSHGQSRIIRQAYFEHPDYVPLLHRAYELWSEVELETHAKLFYQVGLLEAGPADGVLIPGVMQSVIQHNLPIERLTTQEARSRFPFEFSDEMEVVFEPTAGYLLVEECVQTHLDLAARSGAEWRQGRVVEWISTPTSVTVRTQADTFSASRLIVCGGAWSTSLLKDLQIELRVIPKHQYWFAASRAVNDVLPTYFFELPNGYFYGFPWIDERGVKVARHGDGPATDGPVALDGLRDSEDEAAVRAFLSRHLPFCPSRLKSQQACMYTCSRDEHFIVDRHPDHPNVAVAAGLSGHGFKFTSVLGEVLAKMVCNEPVGVDIGFLGISRFR